MDHNQKHSKSFLTRINTSQEWDEIERKFQWQKCSSRKDASIILTWKSAHMTTRWCEQIFSIKQELSSSRGTFLSLKLSLYLLSFLSCIDSREKAFGVFLIMIHGPSILFIWRLVDLSWFSSLYKRCVFLRGTFLSLKLSLYLPHSWVVLILVRKPLECFWLWSMVLLAYLSDDSLMWADFQVYLKDASFREEHFCDWNFRFISSHSWVVLILVRKPLECFWLWSMVLLAYLSDDSLMWADFQVYIKDASFREEHFCHWNFRSISLIPELYWFSWESLWSVFDYDPWSFLLIYLTTRWCELIFKFI